MHLGHRTWDVSRVAGVDFAVAEPDDATRALLAVSRDTLSEGVHVHFLNAFSLSLAGHCAELDLVYSDARAVCFADGRPVSWVSRVRRREPTLAQVRGPSFFVDVFRRSQGTSLRHYLLGGSPGVLDALVDRLKSQYPGSRIVGAESPPYRELTPEELRAQDDRIKSAQADVVWVGLGTPKQDFEAARLADSLPIAVVAVGAAFDFVSGAVPEAPRLMRSAGLEWLFRFASEPRRLWRRYTIGSARFLWYAVRRR